MDKETKRSVVIYSTPTCHFCHMAKEYFKEHEVSYTDHDVATDAQAREMMLEKTGQMGVPVIVISWWMKDDEGQEAKDIQELAGMEGIEGAGKYKMEKEEIIIGFDRPRLVELLEIKE